jgi:hypothetical protein
MRFTVHSLEQEGDGRPRDEYQDFVNGRSRPARLSAGFSASISSVVCLPFHPVLWSDAAVRPGDSDRSTGEFPAIKYRDSFRRFYLITEDMDKPLTDLPLPCRHRARTTPESPSGGMPGNLVTTRIQTVPVREKELFYLPSVVQDRPATS